MRVLAWIDAAGERLATAPWEGPVKNMDTEAGRTHLAKGPWATAALAFSHDGQKPPSVRGIELGARRTRGRSSGCRIWNSGNEF